MFRVFCATKIVFVVTGFQKVPLSVPIVQFTELTVTPYISVTPSLPVEAFLEAIEDARTGAERDFGPFAVHEELDTTFEQHEPFVFIGMIVRRWAASWRNDA